jgi:hypothetical protein
MDYVPKYVTENDVRTMFTPALDYNDICKAELLLKIESVEDYVEAVYFNDTATTADNARIPCLLLIASKIITSPTLAREYGTLKKEVLGDYAYELALTASTKDGLTASPHVIAKCWESMALEMLKSRSKLANKGYTWGLWRSND